MGVWANILSESRPDHSMLQTQDLGPFMTVKLAHLILETRIFMSQSGKQWRDLRNAVIRATLAPLGDSRMPFVCGSCLYVLSVTLTLPLTAEGLSFRQTSRQDLRPLHGLLYGEESLGAPARLRAGAPSDSSCYGPSPLSVRKH